MQVAGSPTEYTARRIGDIAVSYNEAEDGYVYSGYVYYREVDTFVPYYVVMETGSLDLLPDPLESFKLAADASTNHILAGPG